MFVVIVGCGRVGAAIALGLVQDGHKVSVIDEDEDALLRLGEDFPGEFLHGVGIDIQILAAAGTANADAFVAATDGDNTNIVSAQLAKEKFGVKCVVTRVYDPYRAKFFSEKMGLRTVCPTADTIADLSEAVRSCGVNP